MSIIPLSFQIHYVTNRIPSIVNNHSRAMIDAKQQKWHEMFITSEDGHPRMLKHFDILHFFKYFCTGSLSSVNEQWEYYTLMRLSIFIIRAHISWFLNFRAMGVKTLMAQGEALIWAMCDFVRGIYLKL